MISKTSSRNWVVFKAALKRLKWLGILYGVVLFLELPLLLWMELAKQKYIQGALWSEYANKSFLPQMLFHPIEHFINVAVPVIFGLILFHYLQKDRASTFFHSLPIKRGSLYLQNLLAGLTLIWLPILINGLFIYGVFTAFGVTEGQWHNQQLYNPAIEIINNGPNIVPIWQVVTYWLFLSLLMTGLFYIFTVFIGMLTGNVLLQGALTFIGLFLPLGLYLLVKFNLWKLLYGFPRDSDDRSIEWLSPLVSYLNDQNYQYLFQMKAWYISYFVAALILAVASIYLYKARHAEAAGEALASRWMRWIFKYGVAICTALFGGLYFYTLNENHMGVLYLGYLVGGVLGYIIADMVAYKSFHFYRRWQGMLIFGAVFVLLILVVKLDLYGYQRYVPDQNQVKEVFISTLNRQGLSDTEGLTQEENIQRVRQLHQQIIKLEDENKALEKSYNKRPTSYAEKPREQVNMVMSMDIIYVLDSGSKVKRTYTIDVNRYRQALYPIFNSDEAKRKMYGRLFKMDAGKLDQINVNNYHVNRNVRIYKPVEINEALAALQKDVLNTSYEAAMEGKVPAQANIDFIAKSTVDSKYDSYNLNYYPEFKNFEAFLAEHGYLEELFVNPEQVSAIIVKKVGSGDTVELKDKQKIKTLLNWCSLEDERSFIMRQKQPVNKDMVEYYGKIEMKHDNPMFVMFDSSPYAQQLISKMMQGK